MGGGKDVAEEEKVAERRVTFTFDTGMLLICRSR
jgi:hypothetical protein